MGFGWLEIHTLIHLLVVIIYIYIYIYLGAPPTAHPAREAGIYNFFIFIFIFYEFTRIYISQKKIIRI
jgi:hypothetical protein